MSRAQAARAVEVGSPILIPLAHAGHWLPYVIPVVIVLIAVVVSSIRERREREG